MLTCLVAGGLLPVLLLGDVLAPAIAALVVPYIGVLVAPGRPAPIRAAERYPARGPHPGRREPMTALKLPPLKSGSKGLAVEYLQQQLNDNGAKIQVDGVFGAGTRAAVEEFQKGQHLPADGIVGPGTWDRLEKGGFRPRR